MGPDLNPVLTALALKGKRASLPGEARAGAVRLVPTYWNPDAQRIEAGGGAAWLRRHWLDAGPEPSVLLGFDCEDDFRASPEGSVLEAGGITYVSLASPNVVAAIEAAIERVAAIAAGPLDLASHKRNAADLDRELSVWRHVLRGRCAQLRRALPRLRNGSDAVRAEEREQLADLPRDLISRQGRALVRLLGRCRSHDAGLEEPGADLARRHAAAVRCWVAVGAALSRHPSPDSADSLASKVGTLIDEVDALEDAIDALCSRLVPAADELVRRAP